MFLKKLMKQKILSFSFIYGLMIPLISLWFQQKM